MKLLKLFIPALGLLAATACNNKETEMHDIVNDFANLESRAVKLRHQRFELANQIRFTQDTLLKNAHTADTIRLKANLALFNTQKESILQKSLNLADSIHTIMEGLMKNELAEVKDKRKFAELLDKKLAESDR